MIERCKEGCCGCRVCELVCPVDAIEMKYNDEGFLYPEVDYDKCIKCEKCLKNCNVMQRPQGDSVKEVYAAWSANNDELLKCASGGIAYTLGKHFIENEMIVYGVVYGKDMKVLYRRACSIDVLKKMRGSKYVQADTDSVYRLVKEDIEQGRKVLFIGTPCQISALKIYLSDLEYINLYCIDIICGGVTSPLLFLKHCRKIERKIKGEIINYEFRNKDRHGWSINTKITYKTNERIKVKYISGANDKFTLGFFQKSIMRNNCYECSYTTTTRMGDITIGDFWGLNFFNQDINVDKGVSCVLINNEKGKILLKMIENDISLVPETLEHVMVSNSPLRKACICPGSRETVLREFKEAKEGLYKEKELGKMNSILDLCTRVFMLIPPNVQRKLQKTSLYKLYRKSK